MLWLTAFEFHSVTVTCNKYFLFFIIRMLRGCGRWKALLSVAVLTGFLYSLAGARRDSCNPLSLGLHDYAGIVHDCKICFSAVFAPQEWHTPRNTYEATQDQLSELREKVDPESGYPRIHIIRTFCPNIRAAESMALLKPVWQTNLGRDF